MSDRFHMPDNSLDTAPDSYEEEKRRSISLDMARSALTDYYLSSDVIERADYLEHSERTIELMHAFAGDLLPELAYHAGLLHDLPQRQSSDHAGVSEAAEAALSGYFYQSDLSDKEQKYVSGLLADMEVVGLAAKTYRRKFAKAGPSDDLSYDDLSLLSNGSRKGRIAGHLWSVDEPEIGVKQMTKVAKRTNFESIVILAAEKIDHLQNPASSNESKLLHDILEAETFYAPLCEFWGLDAMAMTLKSAAAKRRLEKQAVYASSLSDDGAIEDQAEHIAINAANREYVKAIRFGGPEKVMDILYGEGGYDRVYNMDPSLGKHPYQLAKFCDFRTRDGEESARVISRVKSVGSLAKKIVSGDYRGKEQLPMDIIGLTSVSKDVSDLTAQFRSMLDRVYELEQLGRLTLNPPASKDQPIYIQGSADYKSAIMAGLHDHPLAHRIQMKRDDEPFQVAKFTATFVNENNVSVNAEMQFLTEGDRKEARLGSTSHALRKDAKRRLASEGQVSEKRQQKLNRRLQDIALRKSKVSMGRVELNERSKKRATRFLGRLAVEASDIMA